MFFCREKELSELNELYNTGAFQCVVIYGRKRVGKTSLITEFCKDKPTVFFSALEASSGENLEALSDVIWDYKAPGSLREITRTGVIVSLPFRFAYSSLPALPGDLRGQGTLRYGACAPRILPSSCRTL
jgi:AAA+ ATPase superfamily predicted ATPase